MPIFTLTTNEQENFVDSKPVVRAFYSDEFDNSRLKYKRRSDSLPMSFGTNYKRIDFEEINIKRFIESISEPNFNGRKVYWGRIQMR